MIYAAILLFMSTLTCAEFTPLPADTAESTNKNFKDIDEETRRLDARIDAALSTTTAASTYASLSATQTWSGGNTYAGVSSFTAGAYFVGPSSFTGSVNFGWSAGLGRSTGTLPGASYGYIYAKSADGASQSTGCVGLIFSQGFGQELVWSSTTTGAANGYRPTVLMESCAPGAVCKFATSGYIQAQCDVGMLIGYRFTVSGTRCHGTNSSGGILTDTGIILAQSGNICDVYMGP